MREVDQHAEPVHLAHDLLTEGCETVMPRGHHRRGVGPIGVRVVRERHVTHAEIVVGAQRAERVLDAVAPFHAEHRGDPAGTVGRADLRHGGREAEGVGVARDDAARDLDLLELRARERATALARDVDRPELRTEAAGTQPREVGVTGCGLAQIVGDDVAGRVLEAAHGVRQIVVAIDEDGRAQQLARMLQCDIFGGAVRRGGAAREHQREQDHRGAAHRHAPALKVSQDCMEPVSSPRLNHCVRCCAVPWVKDSGCT